MTLDDKVIEYVRHSYRYYVNDTPTISDGEYDTLAYELYKRYDELSDDSKRLVSNDEVFCGTYLSEYPYHLIEDLL